MRCKDVERLIVDFSEEVLDGNTIERIKNHIASCPRCSALDNDLKKIRSFLQHVPSPAVSEEFFDQTRARCHAILLEPSKAESKAEHPSVPWWIWAAFSTLLILTGILMLPLAAGIDLDQPLSFPEFGVILLVLQNLVMLFFAPVLFQRIRFPKESSKNGLMSSGHREA
jgi:hypothetical protein